MMKVSRGRSQCVVFIVFACCLASVSQSTSKRPSTGPKIIIRELALEGTKTLDTTELNEIRDTLLELRMNEDSNELTERLRNTFQEKGYFDVGVSTLKITPLDPLATPKPVRVEAVVTEGPRFRLANIVFAGFRAFPAERLREAFPVPLGEFVSTPKIRSGLEKLMKLYNSSGYLDAYVLPNTTKSGEAKLTLKIEIHEGTQYHFREFKTYGDQELGGRLLSRWQLEPGAVFDASYINTFLDENSSLLPSGFSRARDLNVAQDCREALVTVEMNLNPEKPHTPTPSISDCDSKKQDGEKDKGRS